MRESGLSKSQSLTLSVKSAFRSHFLVFHVEETVVTVTPNVGSALAPRDVKRGTDPHSDSSVSCVFSFFPTPEFTRVDSRA